MAGAAGGEVVLDADGACLLTTRRNDGVGPLDATWLASGSTNTNDGLRVGDIVEELTSGHDLWIGLAGDAGARRDEDGSGHDVLSMVNVGDLTLLGGGGKELVERVGVVGGAVAYGTEGAGAKEGGGRQVGVQRLGAGVVAVGGRVDQADGTPEGGEGAVDRVARGGVLEGGGILVAAAPGADYGVGGRAGEVNAANVLVLDGDGHIVKRDVLEDEVVDGPRVVAVRVANADADGCVADRAVQDGDGADLVLAIRRGHAEIKANGGEVKPNAAIVDADALVRPSPGPDLSDGGLDVVEHQVAHGELLVTYFETNDTAVESQVAQVTAGSRLHEDTALPSKGGGRHLELNVGERRSLRGRPVDASQTVICIRAEWRSGHINNKVGNLTPENVGGSPSEVTSVLVRITINDPTSSKVAAGLDDGPAAGVTDDLGVVVVDNGAGDEVRAGGEIDQSRSGGGTVTFRATAVAGADGGVDGVGIIIDTIAHGAEILDAAEDTVVGDGVGSETAVSNVFKPVVRASSRAGSRRGRRSCAGGVSGGSGTGSSGIGSIGGRGIRGSSDGDRGRITVTGNGRGESYG